MRDPEKVVWLSQTTLSVDETMQTVDALRERFPLLQSPPSDDICYATQNRQAAVKTIAPEVELFLVVGSANSSNSVRMVEVAAAAGAPVAYLVENADGDRRGLARRRHDDRAVVRRVGARGAGAARSSTGWPRAATATCEEVSHTEERLTFALPQELRRDLRTPKAQ